MDASREHRDMAHGTWHMAGLTQVGSHTPTPCSAVDTVRGSSRIAPPDRDDKCRSRTRIPPSLHATGTARESQACKSTIEARRPPMSGRTTGHGHSRMRATRSRDTCRKHSLNSMLFFSLQLPFHRRTGTRLDLQCSQNTHLPPQCSTRFPPHGCDRSSSGQSMGSRHADSTGLALPYWSTDAPITLRRFD